VAEMSAHVCRKCPTKARVGALLQLRLVAMGTHKRLRPTKAKNSNGVAKKIVFFKIMKIFLTKFYTTGIDAFNMLTHYYGRFLV
jgi:hypothetical protein